MLSYKNVQSKLHRPYRGPLRLHILLRRLLLYSPYVNGRSYSAGNTVSATTIAKTTTTTACTIGNVGCPASGYLTTTTSTSKAHNYECVSGANSAFCGVGAYAPNGIYSSTSWVKKSACSVSRYNSCSAQGSLFLSSTYLLLFLMLCLSLQYWLIRTFCPSVPIFN